MKIEEIKKKKKPPGKCPVGKFFNCSSLHPLFIHQSWKTQIFYQKHRLNFELYSSSEVRTSSDDVHCMAWHSSHRTTAWIDNWDCQHPHAEQPFQGHFTQSGKIEISMWLTGTLKSLSYQGFSSGKLFDHVFMHSLLKFSANNFQKRWNKAERTSVLIRMEPIRLGWFLIQPKLLLLCLRNTGQQG